MCQLFTPLAFMEQSDSGSAHCGLQNNWTLAEAQLFLLVSPAASRSSPWSEPGWCGEVLPVAAISLCA